MIETDLEILTGLTESMSQQETGNGYLIPCNMIDEFIEEMKQQPKDRLFSEFMAEKGFLLATS
jgi:hypothetical protein